MNNPSIVNWIGNYYKSGPSTASKLKTRVFDITGPEPASNPKSQFFFSDNYMSGIGIVSDYKNNSIINNYSGAEFLSSEVDMGEYGISQIPAEEAYEYVLNNAGATLPRRDATDARIVNDVKNGTGRLVNNASEVGGLIPIEAETRVFTVPEEWLSANGLVGKAETDIIENGENAGYTVIEAYVNEWTTEQSKTPPTNANIIVESPATAATDSTIEGLAVDNGEWAVITEGEGVQYKATAIANGGNAVTKMELYDGNTKIGEFNSDSIDTPVALGAGTHYLTCRAINTRGEKTQSTTSIVYVKSAAAPGSYSFTEIRKTTGSEAYTGYLGKGGASMDDTNGVYTIYGSGRITASKSNDSCGFMYKPVKGDFDITVKTENIPKFENQQVSGLMVRAGLEPNDIMAMIGDGWIKYGENVRVFSRSTKGAKATETYFMDAEGRSCENGDKTGYDVPKYMRIQRHGNTLTFSVSNTGITWNDTNNGKGSYRQPMTVEYASLPETMYVGLATDSANGVSVKENFSAAKFSHLTLNGESDVVIEEGKVPFLDTSFDAAEKPEWYIPNGSGESEFTESGLSGNFGKVLLFWGETYRSFDPQKRGKVTATADLIIRKHSTNTKVNNNAGVRVMLNGTDARGNSVKIKSVYAQVKNGFYEDYDDTANPIPSAAAGSDSLLKLDTWYKVTVTMDYTTGKGSYSFSPYTDYNSQTEVYATGEPIFRLDFGFDTDIPLTQLHFQRFAGWEMYLDNVGVSTEGAEYFVLDSDSVRVNCPETDAILYIAEYNEDDTLISCETHAAAANTVSEAFALPNTENKVRLYLWDKNGSPLCEPKEI